MKIANWFPGLMLFAVLIVGCAPTVKVATPEKPITINLNVKIEHEIRVKVEKDLDELFSEESELF
ncbi:MAG: YnbE family lipoprotein [Arenicellales bacterium]